MFSTIHWILYMWEYPASFGWTFTGEDVNGWTPQHQPWCYQPREENHPFIEHSDRLLRDVRNH